MLNIIVEKCDQIIKILKRIETKLTHGFKVQGINTNDTYDKEINPENIFIKEQNGELTIYIRHTDITVGELDKFLTGKNGYINIVLNDKDIFEIYR